MRLRRLCATLTYKETLSKDADADAANDHDFDYLGEPDMDGQSSMTPEEKDSKAKAIEVGGGIRALTAEEYFSSQDMIRRTIRLTTDHLKRQNDLTTEEEVTILESRRRQQRPDVCRFKNIEDLKAELEVRERTMAGDCDQMAAYEHTAAHIKGAMDSQLLFILSGNQPTYIFV